MSLPSQGGFGFGGATRKRRRRGKGGAGKLLAGVVMFAVAGGVAWALLSGDAGPEDAQAAEEPQLAQGASEARTSTTPASHEVAPEATREVAREVAREVPRQTTRQEPEQLAAAPQSRTVRGSAPEQGATPPTREDRSTTPPAVLATPAPREPLTVLRPSAAVATLIQRAEAAIQSNDPVAAREHYNHALLSEQATERDRAHIRAQMTALNEDLMFSPRVYPNDPFATVYEVKPGDSLSRIVQNEGVATEWLLIQRVNRLSNPSGIYVGQKLKLLRGPFHAVVSKSAFRMDLYVGPPEEVDQWVYVRSLNVGLGEEDGTPVGAFKVRRHSKLINPFWRNPRTGEEFAADDPDNPIGEHWIGLQGIGQAETFSGYGIHGTIDPESIGQERSMGCVRMLPDDVALVYELLSEQLSEVHIVE